MSTAVLPLEAGALRRPSSGDNYLWQTAKIAYSISSESGLSEDEIIFDGLAEGWRRETGDCSVLSRRYKHPYYVAILEMGGAIVPLILRELKRQPERWFDALERLTGENPAKGAVTFDEGVRRWIAWGIAKKYIS
jgi:hypothetical protein